MVLFVIWTQGRHEVHICRPRYLPLAPSFPTSTLRRCQSGDLQSVAPRILRTIIDRTRRRRRRWLASHRDVLEARGTPGSLERWSGQRFRRQKDLRAEKQVLERTAGSRRETVKVSFLGAQGEGRRRQANSVCRVHSSWRRIRKWILKGNFENIVVKKKARK